MQVSTELQALQDEFHDEYGITDSFKAEANQAILDKITQHNAELDDLNRSLDDFQTHVKNVILGKNQQFRFFLRRCLQTELTEEQTLRILIECRQFEHTHVKPSCLSHANGAVLRQQQNNMNLTIRTARVAVLFGLIYYRGVGLQRDDALARRYFDFGVEIGCRDAYLMAGLMAKRGHGQPGRKPDKSKASQYLAEAAQEPLLKAIIEDIVEPEATSFIGSLQNARPITAQDYQNIERYPYPAALCSLASLLVLEIDALDSNVESEAEQKRDLIAITAELFLRSYLTYRRLGDREKSNAVDEQLARLYEHQNDIYKLKESELHRSKKDDDEEEAAQRLLAHLQSSVIILQYYYGFIDPSLYETLKTTCVNKETILCCLLNDGVTSSRHKMRRVIDLMSGQIPNDLFAGYPDLLENLGYLAYQAVADCITLYSHVGFESQQEIVEELMMFANFADDILGRLARYVRSSSAVLFFLESKDPQGLHFSNLKNRTTDLLGRRYQQMASFGNAGFATALQLMIGVTPGSKKLQLTKKPVVALMLYNLLDQNDIDFVFNSDKYKISKIDLLLGILEESDHGEQDTEINRITATLKEARFDADPGTKMDANFSHIIHNKDILQVLQDLADFLRLIDGARKPALTKEGPESKTLLYKLYKQNQCFLKCIERAIELFESPGYRPSRVNVFSATFWKSREYEAQLTAAKELLHVCEGLIFDRIALSKAIHKFLSQSIGKQSSPCFALALMKTMTSGENLLIPKSQFDLVKCTKQYEAASDMMFRQFCATFQDYFLPTDFSTVSDVTFTL